MDMSLSKLREMVKDRKPGVLQSMQSQSWTQLRDWTTTRRKGTDRERRWKVSRMSFSCVSKLGLGLSWEGSPYSGEGMGNDQVLNMCTPGTMLDAFSHYALLTTTTEGSLYMLCPWENLKSRWRLIPCYMSPRTWRPNSEHPTLRCSDSKTHWVFWDIKWMVLSIWQQILLYAWTHRLLQIKLKFKWLEGNFLENSYVSHIWGPPPPACSSVGCWG